MMSNTEQGPEMGEALAAGFTPLKKNWLGLLIMPGLPYLLISIIVIGGPLYLIVKEVSKWFAVGTNMPKLSFDMFAPLMGYYAVLIAGAYLMLSMLYAAIYRWLGVRAGARRFSGLRFGADEWRLFVIQIVIMLVLLVPVAGVVGVGIGLIKADNEALGVSILLFGLLFMPLYLALMGVRLSLAPIQTFATGRLKLFGSWRMTRGSFWVIFLSFGVTAVIMALVSTVLTTPANVVFYTNPNTGWLSNPEILGTLDRAELPQLMHDTFRSSSALIALVWLMVANMVTSVFQVAVFGGISFYFYKKLKPGVKETS